MQAQQPQTSVTDRIKRYTDKKTLTKHYNRLVNAPDVLALPHMKNSIAMRMRFLTCGERSDPHYDRVMAGLLDCWLTA